MRWMVAVVGGGEIHPFFSFLLWLLLSLFSIFIKIVFVICRDENGSSVVGFEENDEDEDGNLFGITVGS